MRNTDYNKTGIKQCQDVAEAIAEELGREPYDEEVAQETGRDLDDVRYLRRFRIEEQKSPREEFQFRFKMTIKNHELEKAREKLGLLQEDAARISKIGKSKYCAIECCRTYPRKEEQERIAKVLGRDASSLFPLWLQMFTEKWGEAERVRVVPVGEMSLNAREALMLEGDGREELERIGERAIAKQVIGKALSVLSPREQDIIRMRFTDQMTYEEVGKAIGVTRERVRQIESKALEKIREMESVRTIMEA